MSAHALITGGAGLLGVPLAERLLAEGWQVTVVDVATGSDRLAHHRLRYIQGDVNDEAVWTELDDPTIEVVVHLAAWSDVTASVRDPIGHHRVNVTGTLRLLELARHRKVPRFVLGSSALVHGTAGRSGQRPRPASPYAVSMLAAEQFALVYAHLHGLHVSTLRFFPTYGPRQRAGQGLRHIIDRVRRGEVVPVHGDANAEVAPLHVDDAVAALHAAVLRSTGHHHLVCDIGGGTIGERALVAMIGGLLGRGPLLEQRPVEESAMPLFAPDTDIAREQLGFTAKIAPAEGIAACLAQLTAERP